MFSSWDASNTNQFSLELDDESVETDLRACTLNMNAVWFIGSLNLDSPRLRDVDRLWLETI